MFKVYGVNTSKDSNICTIQHVGGTAEWASEHLGYYLTDDAYHPDEYAWYLNDNTTPIAGETANTITKTLGATDKLVCKVTYANAVTGATFTAQSGNATVPTDAAFSATRIIAFDGLTATFDNAVGAACTANMTVTNAVTNTVVAAATVTGAALAANANAIDATGTVGTGTYAVTVVLSAPGYTTTTLTWYGNVA